MPPTANRIRTLVVDDSPVILRTICSFLAQQGSLEIVATATGGREALAMAESLRPDLILLDVEMPGMSGTEAACELGRQWPATCVVMVTAHENPDLREACLRSGARGFICKNQLQQQLPQLLLQEFGRPAPGTCGS